MIVDFYQLLAVTYVVSMWIVFPLLTNEDTTYLQGVKASHVVFLPILVFAGGLGFAMSQYK